MLKKTVKHIIFSSLGILGSGLIHTSYAQDFPNKPIRLIVPASTGTSTDAIARFYSEQLSKELKVSVIVENIGGAGGLIALNDLLKSKSDGYTIALSGLPQYLLPLQKKANFNPTKDFTPISRIAITPLAIVVNGNSPYKTLAELVSAMKAKPNELTYSTQGVGSGGHLCVSLFTKNSNTQAKHVPYKQTAMAVSDVVADFITFTCQGSASVLSLAQANKLRILAVTSKNRWKVLPEVPNVEEAGVPNSLMSPGSDFLGPKNIPEPIVKKLSDAIMKVGQDPKFEKLLESNGIQRELLNYEKLKSMMPAEYAYWEKVNSLSEAQ